MATRIQQESSYQDGQAMGVNEPVRQKPSVLAFCVGSVAERAASTRMTREYRKLNPQRYRVKSKVGRTL